MVASRLFFVTGHKSCLFSFFSSWDPSWKTRESLFSSHFVVISLDLFPPLTQIGSFSFLIPTCLSISLFYTVSHSFKPKTDPSYSYLSYLSHSSSLPLFSSVICLIIARARGKVCLSRIFEYDHICFIPTSSLIHCDLSLVLSLSCWFLYSSMSCEKEKRSMVPIYSWDCEERAQAHEMDRRRLICSVEESRQSTFRLPLNSWLFQFDVENRKLIPEQKCACFHSIFNWPPVDAFSALTVEWPNSTQFPPSFLISKSKWDRANRPPELNWLRMRKWIIDKVFL